jgi:hypothetical protein
VPEVGTIYCGLVVQKGALSLTVLHMFLSFLMVLLFVSCAT